MLCNLTSLALRATCIFGLTATLFCSALLHSTSAGTPVASAALEPTPSPQPIPVALMKSIVVDGVLKNVADESELKVKRANGGIEPGQTGMRLFTGDEVFTGDDVVIGKKVQTTLTFLDEAVEQNNEVVVDTSSHVQIGSIYSWYGTIILRLRGVFATKTEKVILGVQGTEFELVVAANGDNRITVLEGVVTVEKNLPGPTTSLRPAEKIETTKVTANAFLQSSFATFHAPQQVIVATAGTGQTAVEKVGKKQTVTVTETKLEKQEAPPELIKAVVDKSSGTIILSHPSYRVAQSLTPDFSDPKNLARAFNQARQNAALRGDPGSYRLLGDIYFYWGDSAKALDAYERVKLVGRADADFLTHFGGAHRLAGHLKEAEAFLTKALSVDPNWAPALNELGNVYLDLARAARDKREYSAAQEFLRKARDKYTQAQAAAVGTPSSHHQRARAEARTTIDPGIIQANLGEVLRGLGDNAQDLGQGKEALGYYQNAKQVFSQAQQLSPRYPFAHTGLGDVYREINKIAKAAGDKSIASAAFAQSEIEFGKAHEQHKDLAAAFVGLGNLYENAGNKDAAINFYTAATKARPEAPSGHYHLALTLAKTNPRLAAEHAMVYLHVEPVVFKQGDRAQKVRQLPGVTEEIPRTDTGPAGERNPDKNKFVRVPGFKGQEPAELLAQLKELGLLGQIENQADCEGTGKVLSTRPEQGKDVAKGSQVMILVSSVENPVPNVIGLSLKDAEARLRRAGLVARFGTPKESSDDPDIVLSQKPGGEKRIGPGCPVELIASIHEKLFEVPNFVGRTKDQAFQQLLPFLGRFSRGDVTLVESNEAPGTVVRQNPEAGTRVRRGTRINLFVSRPNPDGEGQNTAVVPDVNGLTLAQAKAQIEKAGLKVGKVGNQVGQTNGLVMSQDPAAGTAVPLGTAVNLVISYVIG